MTSSTYEYEIAVHPGLSIRNLRNNAVFCIGTLTANVIFLIATYQVPGHNKDIRLHWRRTWISWHRRICCWNTAWRYSIQEVPKSVVLVQEFGISFHRIGIHLGIEHTSYIEHRPSHRTMAVLLFGNNILRSQQDQNMIYILIVAGMKMDIILYLLKVSHCLWSWVVSQATDWIAMPSHVGRGIKLDLGRWTNDSIRCRREI